MDDAEGLRVDPRRPGLRHRGHAYRAGLRPLAAVRLQAGSGAAAGRRDRVGTLERRRRDVHEAGRVARVPALGHERRHARPRRQRDRPLPGVPGGRGTLGGCSGPEPRADARDCGDGPLACDSGYVFGRVDSSPRNAADPVAGQGDEAYVVIEATVPGTQRPSGTSYNTLEDGVASQGSIYFTKTENAGATWTRSCGSTRRPAATSSTRTSTRTAAGSTRCGRTRARRRRRGRTARGSRCRSRTSGCPRTRRVRSRVGRASRRSTPLQPRPAAPGRRRRPRPSRTS